MNFLLDSFYPFVVFPLATLLLSLAFTKTCISLLPALGFVDNPKDKHIHLKPVPTAGGIAIVLSFLIIVLIFLLSGGVLSRFACVPHRIDLFIKLLIPITVLVVIGILDDRYGIAFRYRFIVQVAVSAYCWYIGIAFEQIFGFVLPWFISLLLTVLWIVFFINVYNLIDGIDGFSGGIGVISAMTLGVLFLLTGHNNAAVVLFCFAAACGGYLRYNFHPAKIFMGDTGSMFLGFVFAVFGIFFSSNIGMVSTILIPILACGVPAFDGILVVWRRLGNKLLSKIAPEQVYGSMGIADRDVNHIHHRTLNKYGSCKKAVSVLYLLAAVLSVSDICLFLLKNILGISSLVLIAAVVILIFDRFATYEIRNTICIINNLPKNLKTVINKIYVRIVNVALITAITVIAYLFQHELTFHFEHAKGFYLIAAVMLVPAAALCSLTIKSKIKQ